MPAAAFIPALIGAGGAVGGAYLASRGNTKAAETQSDASKEAAQIQAQSDAAALDFAKAEYADQYRQYLQQQANLSPYRDLGFSSLGALATGLGLPAPAAPASVPDTLMPPGLAALNAQSNGLTPSTPQTGSIVNGQPLNDLQTLVQAGLGVRDAKTRAQQLISQYGPQGAVQFAQNEANGAGNSVTLRAPDGTTQAVPADQAAHYIALGARPVGGNGIVSPYTPKQQIANGIAGLIDAATGGPLAPPPPPYVMY